MNDWQTALVPVYLHELMRDFNDLSEIKTVFTIHNIEYQGRYGEEILGDIFGLPAGWYTSGQLEFRGDVSLMKGALSTCDYVTTVSPSYAGQLKYPYFAYGLDGVISSLGDRFCGILNGIDTVSYNPETDSELVENYTADDLAGKKEGKAELQRILGLNAAADAPIIA